MGKEAKCVVRLTSGERQTLQAMVDRGQGAADKLLRARMFLKADVSDEGPGWTDEQIAEAFEVGLSTVHRLRQRLVEEGLDAALLRKPQSARRPAKLDGAQEAKLIAIACSQPPGGRARWTLQLLADKLVELKVVDSISDETVRQRLKKTTSSRGGIVNG
ncbi:MAG TPA: helix-turn-helix domain-containing protein [Gemmataceae bacterium]|nr:helix-turn-helix domain-containing protein [Gemmataceae bacterium]